MLRYFQLLFFFVICFIITSCSAPNTAHKWRPLASYMIWATNQPGKDGWRMTFSYLGGSNPEFRWRIIMMNDYTDERVWFYSDGSNTTPEFIIPGTQFLSLFRLKKKGTNEIDYASGTMFYTMEFLTEKTAQTTFSPSPVSSGSSNPYIKDYGTFSLKSSF